MALPEPLTRLPECSCIIADLHRALGATEEEARLEQASLNGANFLRLIDQRWHYDYGRIIRRIRSSQRAIARDERAQSLLGPAYEALYAALIAEAGSMTRRPEVELLYTRIRNYERTLTGGR